VLSEASGTVLLTVVVNKSLTLLLTAFTRVGCERTLLVVDRYSSVAFVEDARVTRNASVLTVKTSVATVKGMVADVTGEVIFSTSVVDISGDCLSVVTDNEVAGVRDVDLVPSRVDCLFSLEAVVVFEKVSVLLVATGAPILRSVLAGLVGVSANAELAVDLDVVGMSRSDAVVVRCSGTVLSAAAAAAAVAGVVVVVATQPRFAPEPSFATVVGLCRAASPGLAAPADALSPSSVRPLDDVISPRPADAVAATAEDRASRLLVDRRAAVLTPSGRRLWSAAPSVGDAVLTDSVDWSAPETGVSVVAVVPVLHRPTQFIHQCRLYLHWGPGHPQPNGAPR